MLVQDMRHACMKAIIELQRADNDKKENFKVNEAVELFSHNDYILVSTYDQAKYQRFIPVNEHTRSVVAHILDNQQQPPLYLCEVVNARTVSLF